MKFNGKKLFVLPVLLMMLGLSGCFFLRSGAQTDEQRVARDLRLLHSAQVTYQATAGDGKFGSFDDLIKAGLISAAQFMRRNFDYEYKLTRSPAAEYFCISAESSSGAKDYGVGLDGVIYQSAAGGITCYGGMLDGRSMTPLKSF